MGLLKTISDRIRSFVSIENAVLHHGERVAKILDEKFNVLLPEELRIDYHALMLGILELLRDACDKLTEAEQTHVDEQADDVRQRQQREADMRALNDEILEVRDAFTGVYKPANVEEFGFPRNVARTPHDLARQGDHLIKNLEKSGLDLPKPRFGEGLPIDELTKPIRDATKQLRASITDTNRERKEAEVAQVEKDRSAVYYDMLLLWGARMLEGFFTLAGEDELAARVRPSVRRPGNTEEIAEEEEQAQVSEAPDEPAPTSDPANS